MLMLMMIWDADRQSWMVRNGLVASERDIVTANQLLRSEEYTRAMYADNHGMFWNMVHPPEVA